MENIEYLEIYIEDEKFCQEFVEFPFRNSKENHFILCGKKISFEKNCFYLHWPSSMLII